MLIIYKTVNLCISMEKTAKDCNQIEEYMVINFKVLWCWFFTKLFRFFCVYWSYSHGNIWFYLNAHCSDYLILKCPYCVSRSLMSLIRFAFLNFCCLVLDYFLLLALFWWWELLFLYKFMYRTLEVFSFDLPHETNVSVVYCLCFVEF